MINKFRIISTQGIRTERGTGWFYKGTHSFEKCKCAYFRILYFTVGMLCFRLTV